MADQTEVLDATGEITPVSSETNEVTMASYSADDLAKAREQEKAKLYPQMEKMKEELANLKKKAEEEAALRADKEAKRAAKEAERSVKQKEKEESELSFKELLAKKEQEFSAQLESERLEREKAFAILDKERQFNELVNYRSNRIEQERDSIVPELIDLVTGNSQEEIEQSISTLKEKSSSILQSAQAALQSVRQQQKGASVTAPASGPLDNDPSQQSFTPDSLRDMSMADYAKQRAKLLGNAASNRGQGLFG